MTSNYRLHLSLALTALFALLCVACSAAPVFAQATESIPGPEIVSDAEARKIPAKPNYLRINLNKTTSVYARFHLGQVSVATTIAGLKRARPVRFKEVLPYRQIEFPEIDLPFPAAELPEGYKGIRACFVFAETPWGYEDVATGGVTGHFNYLLKEKTTSASWGYSLRFYSMTNQSSAAPKSVGLPSLKKVNCEAQALFMPHNQSVGIGLRVMPELVGGSSALDESGALSAERPPEVAFIDLIDITKNGKSIPVYVKILDKAGKTVAGKTGTIETFGFT